ncbi:MAG: 3-oxoacyl-ACP reductase FabG [Chloroflexi bacterium]|nr:3-oxoacyl-ACP reductase FabG [Chloroflexota bacterium]
MYDLSGKVALVTGAGGEHGMGRAIATRLAYEGANVVVNDVTADPYAREKSGWGGLPDLVRELEAIGRQALGVVADITDAQQVDRMVQQALEQFGHIDILVNNAGSRPGPDRVLVVDLAEEAWDYVQRVNVKGTFLCCRAVARQMIARGVGGRIINISSTAGKRGSARYAAYCASKFAVIGLTQSLALELAPHGINVNAICPSLVNTERVGYIAAGLVGGGDAGVEAYRDKMLKEAAMQAPLGRMAQSSDIASMAAFLASEESGYLTGLSLPVAGGLVMD